MLYKFHGHKSKSSPSLMEPEYAEGDKEDYYVAYDGRGTTLNGAPSTGPGHQPSLVLDGLVSSQRHWCPAAILWQLQSKCQVGHPILS